jgi:hypothetical protein
MWLNADIIEIIASGKQEIIAIKKKLTINSGNFRDLAIFEACFIE